MTTVNEGRKGQDLPSKIVTVVEGIHNGLTKNFTYYPAEKLEQSTGSWTDPYEKPVIKNHNDYTEPLGRIKKSEFKKSTINPDLFTIQLHLEITDPDTIAKVMDGRYHTLSIGGSTDSCICSICNKDILKEGYCGHWKGRTYEGKRAYWTVGNMEFDEISWVNIPADANAQVVVKNALDKGAAKSKESQEGGAPIVENVLEQIDGLTKTKEGAGTQEPPAGNEPAKTQEGQQQEPPVVKTVEQLTTELEAANTKLAEQETKINSLQESVNTLTTRNKELEDENKLQFKQNVDLATFAQRTLAESVVDMRIMLSKEKTEDRDTLVQEYTKSSAKVLAKQAEELRQEKPVREAKTVTNPGLAATNDPHAQTDGDFTEGAKPIGEATLKDFEELMLKAFNK